MTNFMKRPKSHTSWEKVGNWYDTVVGTWGSHYHQAVIIPKLLALLALEKSSSLLDLGCGQGVLARHIPPVVHYVGIDAAKSLIKKASSYQEKRKFLVGDLTKPFPLDKSDRFSHAACVLAIQNIEHPEKVFQHLKKHLEPNAVLVLVLNHPCFRIPRQSAWGFDEATKTQVRKMNLYMSPQKIPITAHPGSEQSETTLSFHLPLSSYFAALTKAGFCVTALEEWCSDKVSTGKAAPWENRSRKEFPLFLAIKAKYVI